MIRNSVIFGERVVLEVRIAAGHQAAAALKDLQGKCPHIETSKTEQSGWCTEICDDCHHKDVYPVSKEAKSQTIE